MPINAVAIPVMIASPGDVQAERDVVRETIHEWNAVNSIESEAVLLPVGWETHSAPELGQRPQDLINERLLKDCDLLIGIFWTRLGTPTGKAASGTVEEIEKHLSAGKPALVYFSSAPVAPQTLDAEQFEKLSEFKKWCKENGLIQEFDSLSDFRQKFSGQLQITFARNPYMKELLAESSTVSKEPATPSLTEEGKNLLVAAAADPSGYILAMRTQGRLVIQTNGQQFGDGTAREQAKWESALKDLTFNGYVTERGVRGEMFQITTQGYNLADKFAA